MLANFVDIVIYGLHCMLLLTSRENVPLLSQFSNSVDTGNI